MEPTPTPVNPHLLLRPVQPVPFVLAPVLFDALYLEKRNDSPDKYLYDKSQIKPSDTEKYNPEKPEFPPIEKTLFPGSIIRQGLRIIPQQYILVEKDTDRKLNQLDEGQTFILDVKESNSFGQLNQPEITIIKNRRCASPKDEHGRTLLLIESSVSLDPLSLLPDNTKLSLLSDDIVLVKFIPDRVILLGTAMKMLRGVGMKMLRGAGIPTATDQGNQKCWFRVAVASNTNRR